jgi:hypothetical protein
MDQGLMATTTAPDLLPNIQKWLEAIEPMFVGMADHVWTGPMDSQMFDIMRRGVVIRQREAIRTIHKMCDDGQGHFGVTLLRPAYEELLWVEYLTQNRSIADRLIVLTTHRELIDNISVQNEYIGAKGMQAHDFSQRYVKESLAHRKPTDSELRAIGKSLGWRENATAPSVAFLARKTGREKQYNFLFHGTSRYVHFSMQEILRRAWGNDGKLTLGSHHFSNYWQDFVIYWSFHIFIHLMTSCADLAQNIEIDEEKWEEMVTWMGKIYPIPIITKGELDWPRGPVM